MAMKILLITVFAILLLPVATTSLDMQVTIAEKIQAHAAWFSLSNEAYQSFSIRWENIGSVNCLARPRIDIYTLTENGSLDSLAYTAWGSEEPSLSGSSTEWELFSGLPEGEYAAILRMYHCNEIFEQEPYIFSAPGSSEGGPLITGVESRPGLLEVHVTGPDTVVIPEEYPRGWIFQSARAEEGRAELAYIPVGNLPTSITLRAVDSSGASSVRELSISLEQETEPSRETILTMLAVLVLVVVVLFVLYVSRNIIKIWRR